MGQSAALYCRVSTADQSCARQERDLKAFAKKAGYTIVGVWKETASGAKNDRAKRKEIMAGFCPSPPYGPLPGGRNDYWVNPSKSL